MPSEPVIHIHDSGLVKPDAYKFESIGIVMYSSENTAQKCLQKGYHVTEACVPTASNHPVSIFSKIHSSHEKIIKLQIPSLFHLHRRTGLLSHHDFSGR